MKLLNASVLIIIVIIALSTFSCSLLENKKIPSESIQKMDNRANKIEESKSSEFFKYSSILLLLFLVFILNNLRKEKKKIVEIQNDLSSYKNQLSQFKNSIDVTNVDKIILQQIVFTIRRINTSLNRKNLTKGSEESNLLVSLIDELDAILFNSGCKKIEPQIGQSALKDYKLAPRVEIIGKKKTSKGSDEIGTIYEVVNCGYETVDGDILIRSQVEVFSR